MFGSPCAVPIEEMIEQQYGLSIEYDQFQSWAEEFEEASLEQKKMIICQFIREINVSRGYELDIVLDINYEQFLTA